MPNPSPVDIKGPKGDKGDPGTGADIQAGTGLIKKDDTLNVTTPVNSILSPSEWDALTPEQQNSGLYVVTTPSDTGTSWDVYSTEETPCGTWIDGKTIYRKCIQILDVLPSIMSIEPPFHEKIISLRFCPYGRIEFFDNMFLSQTTCERCWYDRNTNFLNLQFSENLDISKILIILEYTKTTD